MPQTALSAVTVLSFVSETTRVRLPRSDPSNLGPTRDLPVAGFHPQHHTATSGMVLLSYSCTLLAVVFCWRALPYLLVSSVPTQNFALMMLEVAALSGNDLVSPRTLQDRPLLA